MNAKLPLVSLTLVGCALGASSLRGRSNPESTVAEASAGLPAGVAAPRLLMGERWGCAEFETPVTTTVQCWEAARGASGQQPHARTVRWLRNRQLLSGPDRLCEFKPRTSSLSCWWWGKPGNNDRREMQAWWQWDAPAYGPGELEHADAMERVSLGGTFACLQTVQGHRVMCRGDQRWGQLGGSALTPEAGAGLEEPTYVPNIGPALALEAGTWHACAIHQLPAADGHSALRRVACWGRDDYDQLGAPALDRCNVDGNSAPCAKTPVEGPQIAATGTLGLGDLFTCMTTASGVACWGANRDGFFGEPGSCPASLKAAWPTLHGTVAAPRAACSRAPVSLAGVTGFQRWVRAGPRGLCIDGKGKIRCFGAIPTPVAGLSRPVVSPGADAAACALVNGGVACWGEGYSPPGDAAVPVPITFERLPQTDVHSREPDGNNDWSSSCLVNQGCKLQSVTLAACRPDLAADSWEATEARSAELSGQVVSVRGPIGLGEGLISTAMACEATDGKGCCNHVGGSLMLGALTLDGLFCEGDDSAVCCNAPSDGRPVIATGRLEPLTTGTSRSPWILTGTELCVPRDR